MWELWWQQQLASSSSQTCSVKSPGEVQLLADDNLRYKYIYFIRSLLSIFSLLSHYVKNERVCHSVSTLCGRNIKVTIHVTCSRPIMVSSFILCNNFVILYVKEPIPTLKKARAIATHSSIFFTLDPTTTVMSHGHGHDHC